MTSQPSGCPVDHSKFVQEVLDQKSSPESVNPLNQMDDKLSNKPSHGQQQPLGQERQQSTIPKGDFTPKHQEGLDSTGQWVYPSEQMFFNAMKKKGYSPQEGDMGTIVKIHNAVNEQTWREVIRWEKLYHGECSELKLIRFQGDATKITPKARFKGLLGFTLPFDRHDWYVNRCGSQVHYVVDFYRGQPVPEKPIALHIDARPALDSASNVVDRLRHFTSNVTSHMFGAPPH